jgi:hypothetical protein
MRLRRQTPRARQPVRTVGKRGRACAPSAAASVQSAAAAMASAPAPWSCPTTDSMAARSRPFTATLTPLRPRARHPAEPNPRSRRCHRDARHGRFPVRRRALPPRHPKVVRRPPPTSRLRRRPVMIVALVDADQLIVRRLPTRRRDVGQLVEELLARGTGARTTRKLTRSFVAWRMPCTPCSGTCTDEPGPLGTHHRPSNSVGCRTARRTTRKPGCAGEARHPCPAPCRRRRARTARR